MLMVNSDCKPEPVIALHGVSKCYGKHQVLQSMQLSVQEGEFLALIGHNGAGKTTLLKLIMGLTRPSTGTVDVWRNGYSLGFLPESVVFKGSMSGYEVLRFYAQLKNVSDRETVQLLELVELDEVAGQKVSAYSKGMRQRLGLAQALLGDPRLLVLDEPTSGLDPFFRRKFYQIIRDRQMNGSTVLLSSHSLTEIEAQTDCIAIMKDGVLVTRGSMDDLRSKAGLSVTVRVTLKEPDSKGLSSLSGDGFEYRKINEHVYDVRCRNGDKMVLLKQIMAQQTDLVHDLDIRPPGLDELFIHFAGKEDHA